MLTKDKTKWVGSLKHRITFEKETLVDDGMGNQFPHWEDDFTTWGNVRPLSVNQRLQLDEISRTLTHQITIRDQGRDLTGRRLSFKGRKFTVHGFFNEGEEGAYVTLLAAESLQTL